MEPPGSPPLLPDGWRSYRHPDGHFALAVPFGWREMSPKSDVACYAMAGPQDLCFFEVFALGVPADKRERAATFIKDMTLDSLREEHGAELRVYEDAELPSEEARLVVEYVDRAGSRALRATTGYFMFSNREMVVSINFKAATPDYRHLAPLFEKISRTVRLGVQA